MKLADFDYELPPERVAHTPAAKRDEARLLVHEVVNGKTTHARVRDLPEFLQPGDLIVLNDTRVRPLRFFGTRASGGIVEILLLRRIAGSGGPWRAKMNPARRITPGERIDLGAGSSAIAVERPLLAGGELDPAWIVQLDFPSSGAASSDEDEWIERLGRMPLPPYIDRPRGARDPNAALDRERYQTVFAREPGAVAAPTAGLHFTPELLARLGALGIETAFVTLHVGEGTFQPVQAEDVREHSMHAESYRLSGETVEAVDRCRARGGRVVAVGTTSARVLESCADASGALRPSSGETSLFLLPGSEFRVVDALLTNFHLPRSTLLLLVSAFAGRERVLALYREAIEREYRFFSYGDAMLLLCDSRRQGGA